jgi:hypothetical protein
MKGKHWMNVFEKWVLRKILRSKREELREAGRQLRHEEFHDLHPAGNNIWLMKVGISEIQVLSVCSFISAF